MILLHETGNIPLEYTIKKKSILQAKRIDQREEESLIKDITKTETSIWKKNIEETTKEFHIAEQMTVLSKKGLKTLIQRESEAKFAEEIEIEA